MVDGGWEKGSQAKEGGKEGGREKKHQREGGAYTYIEREGWYAHTCTLYEEYVL